MSTSLDLADPAFMRSVLAASEDCIKVISLDGALTFMSEGGMRVMEVGDFNQIAGCPWPDFWKNEGNVAARDAVAAARLGRSSRFEGMADTFKGTPKFWDVRVSPILSEDGLPVAILSVSRDISELKRAQERTALLSREMSHRTKNTLAMVQAIAMQTLKPGQDMSTARDALLARISSLGRGHDILTQSSWTVATVRDVITGVAEAHDAVNRLDLKGREVQLPSDHVLSLSLALNELLVNAIKYGALSTEGGRVNVSWESVENGGFNFVWEETGGPMVAEPTRKGFGSALLQRALPATFGGEGHLTHRPAGLVYILNGRLAAADAGDGRLSH